jgi:hypothetical protein
LVACCHHHPESVAVLQDEAALRRAVEELVERGHVTWAETPPSSASSTTWCAPFMSQAAATGGTTSVLVAQSAKRAGKGFVLAVFSAIDLPPGAAEPGR